MTAPTLTIRRLSVTTHLEADQPSDAHRVARLLRGVAEHRLDRALTTASVPPGIWCIQRIDVRVRLDLTRPDPALEASWAGALVEALLRALAGGTPEVVHYCRDLDAITDLICGAATGRTERSWAWARIGLLGPGDPSAAQEPGAAIVAALRRRPELALGALTAALRRVSLPPLHRVLGPTGWIAVAGTVVAALAADTSLLPRTPTGTGEPAVSGLLPPGHRSMPSAPAEADTTLARALLAASPMAEVVRRGRLRPDPSTVEAWAVLVAAEADASALRRPSARGVVAALARALADVVSLEAPGLLSSTPAPAVPGPPQRAGSCPGETVLGAGDPRRQDATASASRGEPQTSEPTIPRIADGNVDDRGHGYPTEWAGLLFLLATAAAAGIPDAVLDDPVFAARPLPWVLQGVAVSLGIPLADPAVPAFSGVDPRDRPRWGNGLAVTDGEHRAVTAIAQRWAAVTAEALGGDDQDPLEAVPSLLRRRGRVSYQPGWIEIELSLDQVDIAVRRAGLDLDPGWVPWLGAVVRFSYV